jgi:rod shape-determining protein MreC
MMLEFFRRNRVLFASLACLGLAAVLIASTATGRGRTDRVGGVLLDVMAPLQRGGAFVQRGLSSLWQDAAGIFRRRAEFDRLESRIDQLEEQVVQMDELTHENERLRDLLAYRDHLAGETIAAAVIGRDATGIARTLTIDRGERDGIHKGAAVLAPGGIVGQVFLAGAHAARVLLVTDHNSGIDAVVQRTRARGIVEGTVSEACGLKFVKRTEDLQPGDVIVTSGVDGIFPRGLPIGQIVAVDKRGQGLFQYATVRPFVDFDRLEDVLVTRGPVEAMLGDTPMSAPLE